jgi:MFS family permease
MTRLYNGYQLFSGLLWWLPVFYLYQRDAGLSDEQIFGIQSVYYISFVLLEIPTGALADRFDYRRFLVAGAATLVVANILPVASPSYWGFMAHFLLIALGNSLVSGASSAYLYEYLHQTGAGDRYRQAEGTARAFSLIGRVVCLPAAGFLMQWNTPSPYWLSALGALVAVVISVRLPALPSGVGTRQTKSSLAGAARVLRRSRLLMLLMAQGVALFTLVRILQTNLFQPVLDSKHLPLAGFGIVMAVSGLLEAAGAAGRIRLHGRWALFVLTILLAGCLALLAPAGLTGTLVLLAVFSFASGLAFPIQRQLVNDAITDSSRRATLLSIESIVDRLVCSLVILALGGYLARGAMADFLLHVAIGAVVLMTAVAVLLSWRKSSDEQDPVPVRQGRSAA